MAPKTFHKRICTLMAAVMVGGLLPSVCTAAAPGTELGMVDSIGDVTDVIVGHNTPGPYSLSWTDFDTDGVSVVINGRSLKKSADYNLDIPHGVIAFTSVLATDAIVRVSYHVVPGKSKRATSGGNIPVTLNLRNSASGSLKLTGLYAQNDPNKPDSGKSIIGLGGDRNWGSGKLNSMLMVSQTNDGDQGSTWDRAAMKFGGETKLGMFNFTGSYLHAGESFGGAKEYNTGVGKDIMDFGTAFAPTKGMQATASYQSVEDTTGATKGNRTTTNQQNLVYSPLKSTKLSLGHSTSQLTTADGKSSMVSTNTMQFSTSALNRVNLQSIMTQKFSDAAGDEQAVTTSVSAKPIDQVAMDVTYGTLENKTVGQQSSTDVKVSAQPIKQMAVQAGYTGVDSTTLGQTTKTNVAFQATPVKNLQLKGSAADSVVNSAEQFQRDFSLSSTPASFAKLTALFSQKGANDLDDVSKGAELQLTPSKRARLVAGYKYSEAGQRVLTIYDYLAETKPWDFLSLSGTYRQRDLRASDAVNSAAVSMSLSPARFFALTGQYMANPEDKNGSIQNYNSTALGLTTHIGSVGVETNYFQKVEYLSDRLSDERRLGLALPVFGHGQLTTACKLGRTLGSSDAGTRTYSLGYRHSIGSDFNLSLTGNYTQYLQNKAVMPDKSEVSTEVSLGAKF